MKKDRLIGFILGAISVVFLIMTRMLPKSRFATTVGPDVFPYLASGGLLLCSIGLIFKRDKTKKEAKPFLDKQGWIRVAKLGLILVSFPFLFQYVGFYIAAVVFLFFMIRLFDLDKDVAVWKIALISVIISTTLYLLFTYPLKIQLPHGVLFDLIKR